jgi:hypothetical protein
MEVTVGDGLGVRTTGNLSPPASLQNSHVPSKEVMRCRAAAKCRACSNPKSAAYLDGMCHLRHLHLSPPFFPLLKNV